MNFPSRGALLITFEHDINIVLCWGETGLRVSTLEIEGSFCSAPVPLNIFVSPCQMFCSLCVSISGSGRK